MVYIVHPNGKIEVSANLIMEEILKMQMPRFGQC